MREEFHLERILESVYLLIQNLNAEMNENRTSSQAQETRLEEERKILEEQEEALIRCLLCSEKVPDGVNPIKAKESASSLYHKRMRSIELCSQGLIAEIGHVNFFHAVKKFTRKNPGVDPGGPWADNLAFYRSIGKSYKKTLWQKLLLSRYVSLLLLVLRILII